MIRSARLYGELHEIDRVFPFELRTAATLDRAGNLILDASADDLENELERALDNLRLGIGLAQEIEAQLTTLRDIRRARDRAAQANPKERNL